ncbi:helix-turn-helix domain-containing protein [Mesonia aquimarina]|uniref:helix-turn-helix domain-containing protein n=1 Tax=Mesonia aquimarina TaxID=1504967 RepID=UPI000EF5F8C7|nr:AraC family transcriptional regulator [Mesonia aquimarina]
MQHITSHSIPLKDVIDDLATEFQTEVQQNCDEYSLTIPAHYGEGTIKGIDFKQGLGILIYDCTFKEDIEIRFVIDKVHPLKFLFCEKGKFSHHFENDTDQHLVNLLENIIVASCENNGHFLQFKAGLHTRINSLEINRAKFITNKDCTLKSLGKNLETLFRDIHAVEVFYHHGNYCIKMADLFIEIDGFPEENFLRHIFFEGSAYKILTLQILQYQDDKASPHKKSVLRKYEIKQVQEAAALISEEMLRFETVQKLALHVGLNVNKLQDGFKELYDSTVNGYVHDRRLDIANHYLKETDYSISEIVDKIGLSSKSYFSRIFKDKYGISPSELRKNKNNNQKEE